MLRSIAEIAKAEGEDVRSVESRLACLEVLALGGSGTADDSSETGYYAVRIALGQEVSAAVKFLSESGDRAAGLVIVKLIEAVAQRFGVQVSEKAAAQSVPVIGAVGRATVNLLFMYHFQDMAQGHFVVRRLERKYGRDRVQAEYGKCLARMRADRGAEAPGRASSRVAFSQSHPGRRTRPRVCEQRRGRDPVLRVYHER
jgi:hypothetical protein